MHQEFYDLIIKAKELDLKIKVKSVLRAKYEGLDQDERFKNPNSKYFGNLEMLAIDHLNYYEKLIIFRLCKIKRVPYMYGAILRGF